MHKYEDAFQELIGNEGGFKKQSSDRMDWTGAQVGVGKLVGTKYGITAGTYPNLDIPNLTLQQARAIYKQDWWDKLGCDNLHFEVAFQLFDAAVNHGVTGAARLMQRALGVEDDGKVGPQTLKAMTKVEPLKFIVLFLAERLDYFTDLKTWDENGKGWSRRVAGNLRKAVTP